MTPERLAVGHEAGLPDLSVVRTLVLRARADLPEGLGAVTAVQGFRPDYDRLTARGIDVRATADGLAPGFDAAVVQITRDRTETLGLVGIALALTRPGGTVVVDGQKDDGIEGVLKAVRPVLTDLESVSKSHGKLGWATRPDPLPGAVAAWGAAEAGPAGYVTAPGMFSPEKVDRGSALLSEWLPRLEGRVADLGAGWGVLARAILAQPTVSEVHLIEAEFAALEAARANVVDARARFHWADALRFTPEVPYDAVVCNPPFHQGRAAEPRLGQAFIEAAARLLGPRGRLMIVANRHLPYEAPLKNAFQTGTLLLEDQGFKIYHAERPRRVPQAGARRP